MLEFLAIYGLFLAKTVTIVVLILVLVAGLIGLFSRGATKPKEKIEVKKLNDKYEDMSDTIKVEILPKQEYKKQIKAEKKLKKKEEKSSSLNRRRVYVLNFSGDIRATEVNALREEVTAILTVATNDDEVVVNLESGGGLVNSYGLAASQLARFRQKNIPLTVTIDKVAASGGYLMACVADRIIAAPFAIVGSIGVIAQIPNFHRLLKKHNIDFEQITAGNFKRTLTLFGENTDKARDKLHEEIEQIHLLFKNFITTYRGFVDIDKVATGEHWLATQARELKLVDDLQTSDDYLYSASKSADIFEITYCCKKTMTEKLASSIRGGLEAVMAKIYAV